MSDDQFEYLCTLVNIEAGQVNQAAFEERIRPHLKAFLCNRVDNELS